MKLNFTPIVKQLLILFIVSIIFSIAKNEVVLRNFPQEHIAIARISSWVSSAIGNSISILMLFVILAFTWYLSLYLEYYIEPSEFRLASNELITVYILNEFFKFSLIWIFLIDELHYIEYEKFEQYIKTTTFYNISTISNWTTPIVSVIAFFFNILQGPTRKNVILIISSILFILLLINALL